MAKVAIPYPLRTYVEGKSEVEVAGTSVGQLLQCLAQLFPRLAPHLFSENGQIRKFILIYLNDEDIRYKGGLDAAVDADTTIKIIPAIAGGKGEIRREVSCHKLSVERFCAPDQLAMPKVMEQKYGRSDCL